uniref:Elongation of fatty acids protein n=1 Tax=Eucampia antarctica TaxID=49252 RepID=A0A7S2WNW7_9STRA|mmetsp:Transcript_8183/g.7720  ORF Transcript_8183/g.7720 Transcript_8183/m.7720 type:complete len:293 (+) Transcript_8183:120-998(+)
MASQCSGISQSGKAYEEFSCLYPNSIGKTYMEWEKHYDPLTVLSWMQNHPIVPIASLIVYATLIVWGQKVMKDKPAWKWRRILAVWNLSLSLFSFAGAFRLVPQLLHNLYTMPLHDVLCRDPEETHGTGSSGIWVQLFVLSKFPELFDTFFIVIHKKPLIFLHWYHHVTVLLYCWHSYVTTSPSGLTFVAMNYSVHAIMYGYYFLMAIKMKPKWFNAMVVTSAQISQMFVGIIVTIVGFYYYKKEKGEGTCQIEAENNTAAFIMYGSYLFLFAQFFISRYFKVSAKKTIKVV